MSPSLTQSRRSSDSASSPIRIDRSVVQNDSYDSHQGRFAQISAASDAASSAAALLVSVVRKLRSGAATLRAHAVRPRNCVFMAA